ncbi:hypothetical protein K3495_g2005 [Podosphaera aphanis]|nr:hypothetical protein K3495_g2005 [Podosphaera aphanis]
MEKLRSTWNLHHSVGESHTVIRVSNLQTVLPFGTDAWGRQKPSQPALITCAVSLRQSFSSASAEDAVTESTVHYGTLSKAILGACQCLSEVDLGTPILLSHILCRIQWLLTGIRIMSESGNLPSKKPALQAVNMNLLELDITLPKSSLLGSGVSMQAAFLYDENNTVVIAYSMMMALYQIRIPTLIGVNPNERKAKQIVIATVKIDCCSRELDAAFCELEQLVSKTIEESCFYTLEALAEHVGQRIIRYHLYPQILGNTQIDPQHLVWPSIRIQLSKPTAVTFADAPTVEMLIDLNEENKRLENLQSQGSENLWIEYSRPEFPLQGTLKDWLAEKKYE